METIDPRAIIMSMEVEGEEGEATSPIKTIRNNHFEITFKEESVFKRKLYDFGNLPIKCSHKILNFLLDDIDSNTTTNAATASKAKVKALSTLRLVSRGWDRAVQSTALWGSIINTELDRSLSSALQTQTLINSKTTTTNTNTNTTTKLSDSARERFSMLSETLGEAQQYLEAQRACRGWADVRSPVLSYALLLNFRRTLDAALRTCTDVFARPGAALTCNFDAVELTLKKACFELRSMVPTAPGTDAPGAANPRCGRPDPRVRRVIADPDARVAWEMHIGADRAGVDFGTFMRRLVCRDFPCVAHADDRFGRVLAYHLNFPASDVVTAYRFHTLVSEFGPYARFAENFERYAMRPGFVGFMNTVKAEEVLAQHCRRVPPERRRNTLLIRYSRKHPSVLAFTALDVARRRITHRRNAHRDGTPIPIGLFVDQYYRGYDLLPMGIDDEAVTCPNIFTFARSTASHCY